MTRLQVRSAPRRFFWDTFYPKNQNPQYDPLPWQQRQQQKRVGPRAWIVAGSLLAFNFVVVYLDPNEVVDSTRRILSLEFPTPHTDPMESSPRDPPGNWQKRRHIGNGGELRAYCETTADYFDAGELELGIARAHAHHTQGGSLKSVERLLNQNIDATVAKLGAKFVPTGAKEGTQEVTKFLKDHFAKNFDPRGGYGRPLPGEYEPKGAALIYGGRYVEVADPDNSKERWDFGMGPFGPECHNLLQLGQDGVDGTKWYCQPKSSFLNASARQLNGEALAPSNLRTPPPEVVTGSVTAQHPYENCHVISVGGNDNWKFELQVTAKMKGCITHTFDCTLPGGQPKRKPNEHNVKFYNYCIDSHQHVDEHGRQYITYFDILDKTGLTAPPILFKMDVEGFEYDIFAHMIQQANANATTVGEKDLTYMEQKFENAGGTMDVESRPSRKPLSYWLPQQIMVELHWATRMTGVAWMPRTRTTAEIALLSNMMYAGGGYMPIFHNWHHYCPSCMEVLFFRVLC